MSASVTDVTVTSQITSLSLSAVTSVSTVSDPNATYTISSESTATSSVIISTIYVTPSTTYVAAPTPTNPSSVVVVTQTVISTPSVDGTTLPPNFVTITSTLPAATPTTSPDTSTSSSISSTATPSALGTSEGHSSGGGGLGTGAKIAIAVIIPIVVIAAAFILGLFFWRKRRARKGAAEMRKSEMADYGFNPNENPSLVPVAGAAYLDNNSEAPEEKTGYRGWGNTSNRKTSTGPGSNGRPNGAPLSDGGSQPGGYGLHSSPNGTAVNSEHYSTDPLYNGHPEVGDNLGALGGAMAAGGAAGGLSRHRSSHNNGIRRGPSNASSTYSDGGKAYSEASSENSPGIGATPFYNEDSPYNVYSDPQQNLGPYGDGTYGGAASTQQPVIRDVQARRNTRIERAPTFPTQNPGGIAQNF